MKKSIVFFILTIGWLIEGCYEDKGHYDYIRISGPEVTGIEKFYTVYDGGNFDIHPSVTWTYGELENYTYSWKVDGISVSDKAELTEQVKDLPVKANMYAEFVITDEDTGVEYITQFRVTVSSVYERGWMLLADQGETSMLSLVRNDKIVYEDEKGNVFPLAGDTLVSMNMFGFTPDYFKYSEDFFSAYLKDNIGNPKSEFYIPTMVNKLVADGKAQLRVLHSAAQWFGVTYKEDRPAVVERIRKLIAAGVYPDKLWA